jgi:hypothetical protein
VDKKKRKGKRKEEEGHLQKDLSLFIPVFSSPSHPF